MTMLTIRGFQDMQSGWRYASRDFDVVLGPLAPPLAAVPNFERMTTAGADGYRVRLLNFLPRSFTVSALRGYTSHANANKGAKDLQAMEGTFGDMTFFQAGLTVRLQGVQIVQMQTRLSEDVLGTESTTFDWTLLVQMSCLYHLPYRAQTKNSASAAGSGALSGAGAGFAAGSGVSPSVSSGFTAGANAGTEAGI